MYVYQEKLRHNYIRDNGLKRTHIFVIILFWNSLPDFSGYKPKAPRYISPKKQDMGISQPSYPIDAAH